MVIFIIGTITMCVIIFILTMSIVLTMWNSRKSTISRELISSIKIKEQGDNLEEIIEFHKQNPNIRYHIN